ncbi:hypothetical protein Dimus_037220 [Dionaea muscipula]
MGLRSSGCRWWSLEAAGGTTAIADLLRPWYMKKVGCFVYDDEKHIYELKVHKGDSSYCVYCHRFELEERDEPPCSRHVAARRSHLCHCSFCPCP